MTSALMQGVHAAAVALGFTAALVAQRGDRSPEDKRDMPTGFVVPPATVRSPAEELETFVIQDGYRIELVAAEPLVRDPVVSVFDCAGRLWVCQFETFMRDIDATNELEPQSRVVILHDDDGDGRMDRSVDFLKDVVLPRAVLPIRPGQPGGGALVILPPKLVFAIDRDGDLVADEQVELAEGFGAGLENPEHSGNGLLWGLDNRIHLANDARMWRVDRKRGGGFVFVKEQGAGGGQWGITQDDRGRIYLNTNSDWLRCDLVPGRYRPRAPDLRMSGLYTQLTKNQDVYPVRVTPGVNRGGHENMLENGMLQRNTGVCSPLVYRGDRLPDCDGDVFVCEPCGNLVRRFETRRHDERMTAKNALDKTEFLASTDERFRPVHLHMGPDGALYVVDMYRGVIQHRNYVTTFLRKQVKARGLEAPIGKGRIWRVVPEGDTGRPATPLDPADPQELLAALEDPCGWRRDTAQRALVLERPRNVVLPLRRLLRSEVPWRTKVHVLSVLDGLDELSRNDLRVAMGSGVPALVAFAAGLAEGYLQQGDPVLLSQCEEFAAKGPANVRWHIGLAMGSITGKRQARALDLCAFLACRAPGDGVLRDCLVNAVAGREAAFLRVLMKSDGFGEKLRPLLRVMGRVVGKSRDGKRQEEFLRVTAACMHTFAQRAVLRGLVEALPKGVKQRSGYYVFAATPPSLQAMARTGDPEVQQRVQAILAAMALDPAAMAGPAGVDDADLTPAERGRVAAGAKIFGAVCAACHQPDGRGMQGLAPPLRDSEWVTGDPETLVKIALHGVRGPIEAAGVSFDASMTGHAHRRDEDLAAVLSWLRRAWRHGQSPISPQDVAAVREQFTGRETAWTADELRDGQ